MTVRYLSFSHFREDDRHWRTSIWRLLSFVVKLATGQETTLVSTADNMLSKLDRQDTKEDNCQTLPRQGRTVLQNSCSTEKSVRYSRPVGQRCMPQCCRRTWSDCPGSRICLHFYDFQSCLLCTSWLLG